MPVWWGWALQKLELLPSQFKIDLFANPENAMCPRYATKQMDAFSFDWSLLSSDPQEILLANCPFKLLGKVLAKISCEPCKVLLCVPIWQEAEWWEALQKMSKACVIFPENEDLFIGKAKQGPLPPPKWNCGVYLLDTTKEKPRWWTPSYNFG
jgi:hypothetical protein